MEHPSSPEGPILLFDGVCNLCNSSVLFIIQRDPHRKFRFASLQSQYGTSALTKFNIDPAQMNSVVLVLEGRAYQKSDAALRIARALSGLWPALYIFRWIPRAWRDYLYDIVARNRYRWFGKRDQCMIPTPGLKERFLG